MPFQIYDKAIAIMMQYPPACGSALLGVVAIRDNRGHNVLRPVGAGKNGPFGAVAEVLRARPQPMPKSARAHGERPSLSGSVGASVILIARSGSSCTTMRWYSTRTPSADWARRIVWTFRRW